MSQALIMTNGYACLPYTHDPESIELKDILVNSKDTASVYFVTSTFSPESKSYFLSSSNYYILARYVSNTKKIKKYVEKFNQEKTAFVFNSSENLFQRESLGTTNFISVYYLDYVDSNEDIHEIASLLSRKIQISSAVRSSMDIYSTQPSKFKFPYCDNIIILEVASEKSHQSVNKYCEKTRRDVCRKGVTMKNLFGLSLLEKLK